MINLSNSKRTNCFNGIMQKAFNKNVDLLNSQLESVELTEQEEKTLLWLCENEESTVLNIVSVLKKVRDK